MNYGNYAKNTIWIIISAVLLCACTEKSPDSSVNISETTMAQESPVVSESTSSVTETLSETASVQAVTEMSVTVAETTTTELSSLTETSADIEMTESESATQESFQNNILYLSDNVCVEECSPLNSPVLCESIWVARDKQEFRQEISLIAECEVSDLSEIKISYIYDDVHYEAYETLYTVKIHNNLWNVSESEEIVIVVPDSSYCDSYDIPNLKIGDDVVFFLKDVSSFKYDSLELQNYADYYVSSPADIAVFEGDNINIDGIFANNNSHYASHYHNELLEGEIPIEDDTKVKEIPLYTDNARVIMTREEFYLYYPFL